MAYVVIEDFRGGLDRRRKRAVGQPGTLWQCENAVITRGGEVEKRKKFVSTYTLPAGTFGMGAASGNIYVFGSGADPGVPSGVLYQRLQHPDSLAMSAILDTEVFDGNVYAIAEYSDGSIHHFYNGARVEDWDSGIVRTAMTDNDGIAEHLRALIDAEAAYNATRSGDTITITAAVVGTAFTISQSVETVEGGTDDQSITLVETTPNIPGVTEVLATASFSVTGGTSSAGVNKVTSILVNGIEILNAAVDWTTSHSGTATNIAAQIDSYNSSPEYTADADGAVVTISAVAGSGATPNGFTVAVTVAGDVTVSTPSAMAGGVTAVTGQAQVYTAEIGGTFEVGDKFTITIDNKVFGNSGNPSAKGTFALTHKSKIHALAGSLDFFSAINDPSKWNLSDVGAGFQNMASQDSGSETLKAIGKFQGNLAFLARRSTQLWYVDVDDDLNVLLQTLENTGTLAGQSVKSFGDTDVFYLSDSGIRSLRQISGTSKVYSNDVGTAIDDLVAAHMATLTDAQVAAGLALIEPRNNRYWLTLDETTYVFSYFPASKISAWSTFESGFAPSEYAVIENRIYVRSGNVIYLYGGATGLEYDTDSNDAYTVTVSTPFISGGKVATDKIVTGFDLSVDGTWTINLLHDSRNEARKTRLGIVTDDTFVLEDLAASGYGPMFAVELICETPGAAKIANFALHFKEGK
jgi:hypothetical protein